MSSTSSNRSGRDGSVVARETLTAAETEAYWKRLFGTLLAATPDQRSALPIICYPGHSAAFNRYIDRFQRDAYSRGLARVGSIRGTRAIDFGCGIGRWLRVLADGGAAVTGVDVSPQAIEFCARHVPGARFVCSPLTNFAWDGELFDVASCVTVVQHVPWDHQQEAIVSMARCLRPGGHGIFIELVRADHETTADYEGTGSFANSRAVWASIFERAGLIIEHDEPVLFMPMVNNVHLPVKRRIGRALRALGLLHRRSTGTAVVPDAQGGPVASIESSVDFWFLALTAPLGHILERVLRRQPEHRLARLGVHGSHRLFVVRRSDERRHQP